MSLGVRLRAFRSAVTRSFPNRSMSRTTMSNSKATSPYVSSARAMERTTSTRFMPPYDWAYMYVMAWGNTTSTLRARDDTTFFG